MWSEMNAVVRETKGRSILSLASGPSFRECFVRTLQNKFNQAPRKAAGGPSEARVCEYTAKCRPNHLGGRPPPPP